MDNLNQLKIVNKLSLPENVEKIKVILSDYSKYDEKVMRILLNTNVRNFVEAFIGFGVTLDKIRETVEPLESIDSQDLEYMLKAEPINTINNSEYSKMSLEEGLDGIEEEYEEEYNGEDEYDEYEDDMTVETVESAEPIQSKFNTTTEQRQEILKHSDSKLREGSMYSNIEGEDETIQDELGEVIDTSGLPKVIPDVDEVLQAILVRIKAIFESCLQLDRPYGMLYDKGMLSYSVVDGKVMYRGGENRGGKSLFERLYTVILNACGVKVNCAQDLRNVPSYKNLGELDVTYYPGFMFKYALGIVDKKPYKAWSKFEKALKESLRDKLRRLYTYSNGDFFFDNRDKIEAAFSTSLLVLSYEAGIGTKLRISIPGLKLDEKKLESAIREINTYKNAGITILRMAGNEDAIDVQILQDENAYLNRPYWAYQAMKVKINNGETISLSGGLPIGRKANGEIVDFKLDPSARFLNFLAAGSGSGKGVMTLSIVAAALGSGLPVMYVDFKPDMAEIFWRMEKELGVRTFTYDAMGVNRRGTEREREFKSSIPEYAVTELGAFASVIFYMKAVQLMCAIAQRRADVGFSGEIMFVFDETQALQRQVQPLINKLNDIKKKLTKEKKTEEPLFQYCKMVGDWLINVDNNMSIYINTTGRKSATFTLFIAQSSDYSEWSSMTASLDGGGKIQLLSQVCFAGTVFKMLGKGTTTSKYGLGGKTDIPPKELEYVSNNRFFGMYDGKTTDGAKITIFKPFLTLNYDDPFEDCWIGGLGKSFGAGDVDNETYINNIVEVHPGEEGYSNKYGIHTGTGLMGLTSMYCQGDTSKVAEGLESGLKYVEKFFEETGLNNKYNSVDDYMFDLSFDGLMLIDNMLSYSPSKENSVARGLSGGNTGEDVEVGSNEEVYAFDGSELEEEPYIDNNDEPYIDDESDNDEPYIDDDESDNDDESLIGDNETDNFDNTDDIEGFVFNDSEGEKASFDGNHFDSVDSFDRAFEDSGEDLDSLSDTSDNNTIDVDMDSILNSLNNSGGSTEPATEPATEPVTEPREETIDFGNEYVNEYNLYNNPGFSSNEYTSYSQPFTPKINSEGLYVDNDGFPIADLNEYNNLLRAMNAAGNGNYDEGTILRTISDDNTYTLTGKEVNDNFIPERVYKGLFEIKGTSKDGHKDIVVLTPSERASTRLPLVKLFSCGENKYVAQPTKGVLRPINFNRYGIVFDIRYVTDEIKVCAVSSNTILYRVEGTDNYAVMEMGDIYLADRARTLGEYATIESIDELPDIEQARMTEPEILQTEQEVEEISGLCGLNLVGDGLFKLNNAQDFVTYSNDGNETIFLSANPEKVSKYKSVSFKGILRRIFNVTGDGDTVDTLEATLLGKNDNDTYTLVLKGEIEFSGGENSTEVKESTNTTDLSSSDDIFDDDSLDDLNDAINIEGSGDISLDDANSAIDGIDIDELEEGDIIDDGLEEEGDIIDDGLEEEGDIIDDGLEEEIEDEDSTSAQDVTPVEDSYDSSQWAEFNSYTPERADQDKVSEAEAMLVERVSPNSPDYMAAMTRMLIHCYKTGKIDKVTAENVAVNMNMQSYLKSYDLDTPDNYVGPLPVKADVEVVEKGTVGAKKMGSIVTINEEELDKSNIVSLPDASVIKSGGISKGISKVLGDYMKENPEAIVSNADSMWREILLTCKRAEKDIKRVELTNGQMRVNKRLLNLNGIIDNDIMRRDAITLASLVNFKIMLKYFNQLELLLIDEEILDVGYYEFGRDVIKELFNRCQTLNSLLVQIGDGSIKKISKPSDGQDIEKGAQSEIKQRENRAKLKAFCLNKRGKNFTNQSFSSRIINSKMTNGMGDAKINIENTGGIKSLIGKLGKKLVDLGGGV